jgi:hypothetical protein
MQFSALQEMAADRVGLRGVADREHIESWQSSSADRVAYVASQAVGQGGPQSLVARLSWTSKRQCLEVLILGGRSHVPFPPSQLPAVR